MTVLSEKGLGVKQVTAEGVPQPPYLGWGQDTLAFFMPSLPGSG